MEKKELWRNLLIERVLASYKKATEELEEIFENFPTPTTEEEAASLVEVIREANKKYLDLVDEQSKSSRDITRKEEECRRNILDILNLIKTERREEFNGHLILTGARNSHIEATAEAFLYI